MTKHSKIFALSALLPFLAVLIIAIPPLGIAVASGAVLALDRHRRARRRAAAARATDLRRYYP